MQGDAWVHAKDVIQAAGASYLAFFALGLLILGIAANRLFELRDSNRVRFVVFLLLAFFVGSVPFIISFLGGREKPGGPPPQMSRPEVATATSMTVALSIEKALLNGVWGDETDNDFAKPCDTRNGAPASYGRSETDLFRKEPSETASMASDWISRHSLGAVDFSDDYALVLKRAEKGNESHVAIRGPHFPEEVIWINSGGHVFTKRCS